MQWNPGLLAGASTQLSRIPLSLHPGYTLNLPPAEPVVKKSVEDFARRVLGADIQR